MQVIVAKSFYITLMVLDTSKIHCLIVLPILEDNYNLICSMSKIQAHF